MFQLVMEDKILGKRLKFQAELDKSENFVVSFCVTFDRCCEAFIYVRENFEFFSSST